MAREKTTKKAKPTDPSVDVLPVAKEDKTPKRIRHTNPKVADHVAKVLLKNSMDMESAVKELAPELSPARVAETVEMLEESSTVKNAIETNLRKQGLDESSKDVFVQKMWGWLDSIDEVILSPDTGKPDMMATAVHRSSMKDFALRAAAILSKAFVTDRVIDNKPQSLTIKGWEKGVEKMLGVDEKSASPTEEKFDA